MPPIGEFKPACYVCRASALTPSGTGTRPCALSLSGRCLRIPSGSNDRVPAARRARALRLSPSRKRGCRECRVHAAPAVSCAKLCKEAHTSIQVQRRHSGIPRAMVLRLMPCSPRRRIRLVTVVSGLMARQGPVEPDMPPRTWRQQRASGPHGFAVRDPPSPKASADKPAETSGTGGNSAVRPARRCSLTETALRTNLRADAVASTTSHPAFVTIAKRPSWGMRWRELVALICPTGQAEYFLKVGLTENH